MKKLFVLIGESGSGKTTLVNELVRKYSDKLKKVITCTSRTPRVGEIDGEDYHFLPREYFDNNPDLVLVKNPVHGDCYGTRKSELFSKTHNLLLASKPTGIPKLVALGFQNLVVVRIEIGEMLKIERMRHRGDSEQMILKRLELDSASVEIDFGNVPIIELNSIQSLDEKVGLILKV